MFVEIDNCERFRRVRFADEPAAPSGKKSARRIWRGLTCL
jgi:hypothetical protein